MRNKTWQAPLLTCPVLCRKSGFVPEPICVCNNPSCGYAQTSAGSHCLFGPGGVGRAIRSPGIKGEVFVSGHRNGFYLLSARHFITKSALLIILWDVGNGTLIKSDTLRKEEEVPEARAWARSSRCLPLVPEASPTPCMVRFSQLWRSNGRNRWCEQQQSSVSCLGWGVGGHHSQCGGEQQEMCAPLWMSHGEISQAHRTSESGTRSGAKCKDRCRVENLLSMASLSTECVPWQLGRQATD